MLKIRAILFLHLKEFFTSPGTLALMFIMPILFSLIFGSIAVNSNKKKPVVDVVMVKKGQINLEIAELLKKNDHFTWKEVTLKQAKENVASQKAVAGILIPANIEERITGQKPLLDIMVQKKSEDYLALVPQLQGTANLILTAYQSSEKIGKEAFPKLLTAVAASKGVEIERKTIQKQGNSAAEVNLMFIGFSIMFMMFGLSGAASMILEERSSGTWGRLLTAPPSKLQISLGYLLSYFIMGWIQLAVLMAVTFFMFDTDWGNLFYFIPFASLVIVCIVGFGLMIAGLVKTKQQAAAISAVLIVSTCMIGGVYWPLDFVPELMQKIALGVPQSWAMWGFREIISGSLHTASLLKDTAALAGFTIVFFSIGLKRMKFQ